MYIVHILDYPVTEGSSRDRERERDRDRGRERKRERVTKRSTYYYLA